MNNQPLSHDDATALMTGSPPPDRPDLVKLATVIDDFRDALAEPAPQPSPQLADWLTGAQPLRLLGTEPTATDQTPVRTNALRRRIRATARALAALGVTAKIALGGTAALAAVASAGAAGVLPQGPQAVFDRLLDNNHADTPLPPTPSNYTQETGTPPGGRPDADSGAQGHTEQRSPDQTTSEPQDRDSDDSDDRSQRATTDPARGGSDPPPGRDETEDSDEAEPERLERPNDQPDHDSDAEEDHESGGEDDDEDYESGGEDGGEDHESDDEPDHFDDDSDGEEDRSDVDDSAEDDSSSDASHLDGSTDTRDDAEHLDTEMSDG